MKVLEHGWVYNEKHGITECECGCKYKYNKEEVKSAAQIFIDSNRKFIYYLKKYVNCTECGKEFWISVTPISKEEYDNFKGCE